MTAGASLQLGRRAGSIEVRGLTLSIGRSEILRGVDLSVPNGAITGLAGESGSGKTMTGLAICGLQPQGS
ncbi:MAG: ATP-binding cassette domain-containing protein, partial [Lapillicoccus sp.]